ncbi:VanW family protein [Candidatus Microgenomates bacterium]|nr:VanW family protein [Candidatus Microgenomates bacterium]
MIKEQVIGLIALVSTVLTPLNQKAGELLSPLSETQEEILAEHDLNLETRAKGPYVNEVFKFNILHAIDLYNNGFVLQPNEVFAFHENIRLEFNDLPVKTGWTKYTAKEGYKTVLGLPGNGVCHLASLMNWVSSEAGLEVIARVNHNFAPVPEVPKEYGTSIRYMRDGSRNTKNQNLYIKNIFDFPVEFVFETDNRGVNLKILSQGRVSNP